MFIFGFFNQLIFHLNLWMETGAPGGKPPARGPQKTASHRSLTCVLEIGPVLKLSNLRGNVQPPGFHGRQSIFCCRIRKIMNNVWLLESEGLTLLTSNHARWIQEKRRTKTWALHRSSPGFGLSSATRSSLENDPSSATSLLSSVTSYTTRNIK